MTPEEAKDRLKTDIMAYAELTVAALTAVVDQQVQQCKKHRLSFFVCVAFFKWHDPLIFGDYFSYKADAQRKYETYIQRYPDASVYMIDCRKGKNRPASPAEGPE